MSILWQWPQIAWAVLTLFGLLIHAANHGEPVKTTWSFPMKVMTVLISGIILYYGGFFTEARP